MFKDLLTIVRGLNIPQGTFAIFGSGPMAVRVLKEPNDLDVIVTTDTYDSFKHREGWIEKLFRDGKTIAGNYYDAPWIHVGVPKDLQKSFMALGGKSSYS